MKFLFFGLSWCYDGSWVYFLFFIRCHHCCYRSFISCMCREFFFRFLFVHHSSLPTTTKTLYRINSLCFTWHIISFFVALLIAMLAGRRENATMKMYCNNNFACQLHLPFMFETDKCLCFVNSFFLFHVFALVLLFKVNSFHSPMLEDMSFHAVHKLPLLKWNEIKRYYLFVTWNEDWIMVVALLHTIKLTVENKFFIWKILLTFLWLNFYLC